MECNQTILAAHSNRAQEANFLLHLQKKRKGRLLRRFLNRETFSRGTFIQGFCRDEFTTEAFEAYQALASNTHQNNLDHFPKDAIKGFDGMVVDDAFGSVFNVYRLNVDIPNATVKELLNAVRCIAVMSELAASALISHSLLEAAAAGEEAF